MKKNWLERIGIFIFSLVVAGVLVSFTPSIPDELLVVAWGIYETIR